MDQFPVGNWVAIAKPMPGREVPAVQAGPEFAGGGTCFAGRKGIATGRRKTFLAEEESSAGQDEMTVTREQSMARQATALSGRLTGNPHASAGRGHRIPLLGS